MYVVVFVTITTPDPVFDTEEPVLIYCIAELSDRPRDNAVYPGDGEPIFVKIRPI